MNLSFVSALAEFSHYNLVFDGIIIFFTVVYFFAGLKRGMKRTLWFVVFDVISIIAAVFITRFVTPYFIHLIPALVPKAFSTGLKFFLIGIYDLLIKIVFGVLVFLIIRFAFFKKILVMFADNDYNKRRKKGSVGRLVSAILTAGLAYTLSAGAIVGVRTVTGNLVFRNYEAELSETYVAKYAHNFIVDGSKILIATESITNPDDIVVNKVTNGKYSLEDVPNYRESISRLSLASLPYEYLNAIHANTNEGLVTFNQDLKFWMAIAEVGGHYQILDQVVAPLARIANELGYNYTGAEEDLFDIRPNQSYFSQATYEFLVDIYY